MSTCKSLNYKIYRLNTFCKCSCHALSSTTILPFFKWRTNGTKRARPKTRSPGQYDVAGTLSPPPGDNIITNATENPCIQNFPAGWNGTHWVNGTNAVNETTAGGEITPAPVESNATATGGATTETTAVLVNGTASPVTNGNKL